MTTATTLPPMTVDENLAQRLAEAARALDQQAAEVADLTAARDDLIRQAVAAGGSLREVGELAGLSHTAVRFIAHGRGPRRDAT